MATVDDEQYVLDFFAHNRPRLKRILKDLVPDVSAVIDEAQATYESFVPDSAYVDDPHHVFADSLFYCNVNLAVYLALRDRGVDVHVFGAAVLADLARADLPEADADSEQGRSEQRDDPFAGPGTHAGEFVAEMIKGDGKDAGEGFNITSCGICYQFSKYDAMDLVPYMCASDDVVSDKRGQGLRRTGTIALGAHQCDFRFNKDGAPARVAELFPDRIRFVHQET